MDNSILSVIKAKRATVKFGSQIEVDAYLLPDGEFRFGIGSAGLSIGYSKEYLGRLSDRAPLQLKALRRAGYTGLAKSVALPSINGGGRSAETISLSDYKKLITFAAKKGKAQAEALLDAILDVSLEDFARAAFAIPLLTPQEKSDRIDEIVSYYLEEQIEIDDRRLPGDNLYLPMGIN
jgi:hypothetical protein